MFAAALLLLVQDAPPPPRDPEVVEGEEITVRATYGRTTMLFDKMADGTLRNCRIMVSSGSQKRDTDACKAIPVCYEKTRDEVTECVELTPLEQAQIAPGAVPPPSDPAAKTFTMPQLIKPREARPVSVGPITPPDQSDEPDRQRVTKLPPPPTAPKSDGPAVRITTGRQEGE